jgi:hypothetical protein
MSKLYIGWRKHAVGMMVKNTVKIMALLVTGFKALLKITMVAILQLKLVGDTSLLLRNRFHRQRKIMLRHIQATWKLLVKCIMHGFLVQ